MKNKSGIIEQLEKLNGLIDNLGLRNYSPASKYPGTTEKIAMELETNGRYLDDLACSMRTISNWLEDSGAGSTLEEILKHISSLAFSAERIADVMEGEVWRKEEQLRELNHGEK